MAEKLTRATVAMCPECEGKCEQCNGARQKGLWRCLVCGRHWARYKLYWGIYQADVSAVVDAMRRKWTFTNDLESDARHQGIGIVDVLIKRFRNLAGGWADELEGES